MRLLRDLAKEFKSYFSGRKITAIMTVEASGIPLASICADESGLPLIFAQKAKSNNMNGALYKSEIFSYTYKKR